MRTAHHHLVPDGLRHHLESLSSWGRLRLQLVAVLVIGWAPLVVLGVIQQLWTGRPDPFLLNPSLHVRLLVSAPLLRLAQLAFVYQSNRALGRLVDEGFVAGGDRARFDAIVRSAARLRNANLPAFVMLAVSLGVGFATMIGWLTPTGVVGAAASGALSASRTWFGCVALPLFVLLLCRSLWHWLLWIRTLVGLARLRLRLEAAHPDRRGGIAFLRLPSMAFHAPFGLAIGSVLSATWGMQMRTEGAQLAQFHHAFAAFVVLGQLLAFGPLLVFIPRLFLAATAGRSEYGSLATDYVRRFRERWLRSAAREDMLGTEDLQALNDLGGVYRETVRKVSPLIFGPRDLIAICMFMLLPMVPLLLAGVPLEVILQRLGKMVLGAR